ncbi:MAG: hypothetical protein AABP62_08360 [Planctomycetota bacterium]
MTCSPMLILIRRGSSTAAAFRWNTAGPHSVKHGHTSVLEA